MYCIETHTEEHTVISDYDGLSEPVPEDRCLNSLNTSEGSFGAFRQIELRTTKFTKISGFERRSRRSQTHAATHLHTNTECAVTMDMSPQLAKALSELVNDKRQPSHEDGESLSQLGLVIPQTRYGGGKFYAATRHAQSLVRIEPRSQGPVNAVVIHHSAFPDGMVMYHADEKGVCNTCNLSSRSTKTCPVCGGNLRTVAFRAIKDHVDDSRKQANRQRLGEVADAVTHNSTEKR